MQKQSAGIVLFRRTNGVLEVLAAHPGGPYFINKDAGFWSIPKGEFTDEEPFAAALREFQEEMGTVVPAQGEYIELTPVTQKNGKIVYAWAVEGDLDATAITSNTFELEWPPRSGKFQIIPEMDRAEWFTLDILEHKLSDAQFGLVEELVRLLTSAGVDELQRPIYGQK